MKIVFDKTLNFPSHFAHYLESGDVVVSSSQGPVAVPFLPEQSLALLSGLIPSGHTTFFTLLTHVKLGHTSRAFALVPSLLGMYSLLIISRLAIICYLTFRDFP